MGVKCYGFLPSDMSTCTQWEGGCYLGLICSGKEPLLTMGLSRYNRQPWALDMCPVASGCSGKDLYYGVASLVLTHSKSSQTFRIWNAQAKMNHPSFKVKS